MNRMMNDLDDMYELWLREYLKENQIITSVEEFNDMFHNRFEYDRFKDAVISTLEDIE